MTIPPSEVDEIHARQLERARRIATMFIDSMQGVIEAGPQYTALALGAAFGAAADLLHEEADAATEAKRRGHQSLTKDLRNAAGRIMGIAQDLAELAKLDVQSVQLHVPSGDADGSDPSAVQRLAELPTASITLSETQVAELADVPDIETSPTRSEASTQFFADRPPVDDVRAGETETLPELVAKSVDDTVIAAFNNVDPEDVNTIMTAPHLAFEDPLPISRQFMAEPFPGANEHKRTFADLMRPVDPAGIPDHWSWSQLTSAEDCGVAHRLSRLEHVPQQPQWANIGGTTFHTVTEAFDRGAWQMGGADRLPEVHPELIKSRWEEAFAAEIERVFHDTGIEMGAEGTNYRASKGGKEGYTWWLIEGERMLELYIANRRKLDKAAREAGTLAEPLELLDPNNLNAKAPVIEWPYIRPVPGPTGVLQVHGVIDRAYRCVDGSIMIKDLKTAAGTSMTGQLGEYAWALNDLLGGNYDMVHKIRGCFYDARKGLFSEPIELLGHPHHPHEEYVFRYHAAQAARNAGLYMPRRSDWCNGCSVKHACPVGTS